MARVTVHLRFARVAPRKARAVVDIIRNKSVSWAESQLSMLPQKASRQVLKILKSGIAAAKEKKMIQDNLFVAEARVQEGPRLKRAVAHFRGVARPIEKQMSHITLILTDEQMENGKLKIEKTKAGVQK